MIKVNLLSQGPGAEKVAREWVPASQKGALKGLAMLMVTALGVGGYWFYLSSQKSSIETRIAAAETELVRLNEAAKLVERATKRKNELSERLALIDRLRESKRGPVTLLETVSRSTPDGSRSSSAHGPFQKRPCVQRVMPQPPSVRLARPPTRRAGST